MSARRIDKGYGRDIRLLFIESAVSGAGLFMPVAYLVFADVGLSQFDIGLLQALFAFTIVFLEIPTGYLADRISYKMSNAFGDVFMGLALLVYVVAGGFGMFLMAEVLFGVGSTLTSGADSALLRAHSERRGLDYKKVAARMQSIHFAAGSVGALLGGIIGAYNIRWPFLLQALALFAVAGLSFTIREAGSRRVSEKHPVRDMVDVVGYCLSGHPELFRRIALSAALTISTLLMVWFMTPLFLQAGIALAWHGLLFAGIGGFAIFGSEYVARHNKLSMTASLLICAVSYGVIGWHVSLFTVPLFWMTSFARGVNSARVKHYIQDLTPADMQATAVSAYSTLAKIVSGLSLLLINYLANFGLNYGLLASAGFCIIAWVIFRVFWPERRTGKVLA